MLTPPRSLALVFGLALATSAGAGAPWFRSVDAARANLEDGKLGAAERNLERARRAAGALGPEHAEIFAEENVLGVVLAQEGQLERGTRLVRKALDGATRVLGADSEALEPLLTSLGNLLVRSGEHAEAFTLLKRSYEILQPRLPSTNAAFQELVKAYAAAARGAGHRRELLSLYSHYGHVVDLGPLDPVPAEVERGQPVLASLDEAPALRHPEAAARPPAPPREPEVPAASLPKPPIAPGDGQAPKAVAKGPKARPEREYRELPPHDLLKVGQSMMLLRARLAPARNALDDQLDWIRQQGRRFRGRRRYARHVVIEVHNEARRRARQIANLAVLPTGLKRLADRARHRKIDELLATFSEEIETYEELAGETIDAMQRLLEKVSEQVS